MLHFCLLIGAEKAIEEEKRHENVEGLIEKQEPRSGGEEVAYDHELGIKLPHIIMFHQYKMFVICGLELYFLKVLLL